MKSTDTDKDNYLTGKTTISKRFLCLLRLLTGWVKFSLRNSENMATDKWQKAFHFCKMGAVRCILDKGQPLTKGKEYG